MTAAIPLGAGLTWAAAGVIGVLAGSAVAPLAGRVVPDAAPAPVSWRQITPLALGSGLFFALAVHLVGVSPLVVPFLLLDLFLVAVIVTDIQTRRIPTRLVYPAAVLAAVSLLAADWLTHPGNWGLMLDSVYGFAIGFGLLAVLHLINPKGMGFGDVRLGGVIGVVVGRIGVAEVFTSLLVAFILAAAAGVVALAATRGGARRAKIPFAPFLAAGVVFSMAVPVLTARS